MPRDISYCTNEECPLKANCERSLQGLVDREDNLDGYRVSVSTFKPENEECDYFIDLRFYET